MSIQDAIEQYEARNLGEMPDMSLDGELPGWDKDWTEGIEEFKNISTDVLWAMLGRPDKDLPWFNTHHDPDGIHNRWESRDDEWFANPKNLFPSSPAGISWSASSGCSSWPSRGNPSSSWTR